MNPQDLEMYLQNMGLGGGRMRRPMPPGIQNMMRRPMQNGSLLGNSQLPPQLNNMPIEQILAQVINNGGGGGGNGGGGGLPPTMPPGLPPRMPPGLPPMPMRPPPRTFTPQPVRPPIRRS